MYRYYCYYIYSQYIERIIKTKYKSDENSIKYTSKYKYEMEGNDKYKRSKNDQIYHKKNERGEYKNKLERRSIL